MVNTAAPQLTALIYQVSLLLLYLRHFSPYWGLPHFSFPKITNLNVMAKKLKEGYTQEPPPLQETEQVEQQEQGRSSSPGTETQAECPSRQDARGNSRHPCKVVDVIVQGCTLAIANTPEIVGNFLLEYLLFLVFRISANVIILF